MKYYTKEHEWFEIDGDTATVGISIHAAAELGDITFVELPESRSYNQGEVISVVESVKAASDIYSPISGTVCEVNSTLEDSPEVVNDDAEGDGWICKLSGVKAPDLSKYMDASAYAAYIAG